jgi:hypothetical protein
MRRARAGTRNVVVHFLTGEPSWERHEVPHIACGRAGRRSTKDREKVTCPVCRALMPVGAEVRS